MRLKTVFLCFVTVYAQFCKAGTLQWDSTNPSCVLLDSYFTMGVRDTAAEEIWLVYEYNDIIHETKWTKPIAWNEINPRGCWADGVYYAYTTLGLPFEAESRTANGVWDQIYAYINVVETLNPSGQINIDNYPNNSVITKPTDGGVSITVQYKATDHDGDLRGIRPQKWNAASNELEVNSGAFETVSGYTGEIIRTYSITEPGEYYFWMDMRDARLLANGTHVSTAAWQSGYHLTIRNQNHAPEIVLDTVSSSASAVITGNGWAADPDDGAPVSRVEIWLDGVYKMNACLGEDRPDVALSQSRPDYRYSGYSFSLSSGGVALGQHELTVKAYDNEGASAECSRYFTVVPSIVTPQYLAATALSSYSIRLDWPDVAGSLGSYELQRRGTASEYEPVATLGGSATSHVDTGLTALSTYAYRIRAISPTNLVSGFSTEAVAATLDPSQNPTSFDEWARSYGLDPARPGDDTDGDGISNYNEYLTGSDPLSAASSFHLVLARPGGGYFGINTGSWIINPVSMR